MDRSMNPSLLVEPLLVAAPATLRRAVRAGVAADAVGGAFLGGYRAATGALVPGLREAAVAATEDRPLHPATIATTFDGAGVTGHKRFVTGVPGASELVVLATAGRDGDRQRLVAVVVEVEGPGVRIRPMDPLPFVPEIPHAEIDFTAAPVVRVLPGDGWADVFRPFRTIEDLHVIAAVVGYLLGAAPRAGFERTAVEALCATLAALVPIAAADPSDPGVHVALAGVLDRFTAVADGLSWDEADPVEAGRWTRDRPLLQVASRARGARLQAAWRAVGG